MCDHVGLEVGRLGEALAALGTLVGLEAGVCAVVQLQALQAGEALPALVAVVLPEPLGLVRALVAVQRPLQLEALPAGGALVRLAVGVRDLVQLQALGVAEGLAALGAGQQLLALVRLTVEVEALSSRDRGYSQSSGSDRVTAVSRRKMKEEDERGR